MCSTDLRCKEQHERVNLIIEPALTEPETQVTMEGKKKVPSAIGVGKAEQLDINQ